MANPLDKFWQMTQRNAAKRPAPPDPNAPQPPAPGQSMANAINEPLRIAHNLEGKIKSIKDRIDALQLQMDQLKNSRSAKEDWEKVGAEFEKFADALEDAKKDLQEMAHEIPSATDQAYDQNAADLAASIGKSLTEINNLEARISNLDSQVVDLEKKVPSSRAVTLAPGATARAGASSAPIAPPPPKAKFTPTMPPPRVGPAPRAEYDAWAKQLVEIEAVPSPLAEEEARARMMPSAPVDPAASPVAPIARAINDRALSGALAKFKDPAFLKHFTETLQADAKRDGGKELQRILQVVQNLDKNLQGKGGLLGMGKRITEEQRAEKFEIFARAMIDGEGMDELIKQGNEFAIAATDIAATDIVRGLAESAEEIAEFEMPKKPDQYAKEVAPIAGNIHQKTRGLMGLDVAFAIIAGSSAFSGGKKSAAAAVAMLPDTWRAQILSFLENPIMSGVQTQELVVGGIVGGAAYFIARQIMHGKDLLRDAGVKYPTRYSLPAAFQEDPIRMAKAIFAVMVAAGFAGHGLNYAIIGSKLMSEYAEKAQVPLKPALDVIEAARKTVGDVPANIETFFKAYINVERGGVAGVNKDLTPEQQAIVKEMKWKFSPTQVGDGPITAAKRYALFREATPKLRPGDKDAIDTLFAGYGIPDGKGFAFYASELSKTGMGTTDKPLAKSQAGLKGYIEHLQRTGPFAHFLWELSIIGAQSGQEVPNLLLALETSKNKFAEGYKKFSEETWQKVVQARFNEAMSKIGSKGDVLDMKFPPVSFAGQTAFPKAPEISPYPFAYSDREYEILGEALGIKFDTLEKKLMWNFGISAAYGVIDTVTVVPSMRYSRRRREYFGEKIPPYERALEDAENQLATMIASYYNEHIKMGARIIAGVDLAPMSIAAVRTQLHEKAVREVLALKSADELKKTQKAWYNPKGIPGRIQRKKLSFSRLFQMPLGESAGERFAFQGWLESEIGKIKKDKFYLGTLLSELNPDFKPLFDTVQQIVKNPKKIADIAPEYIQEAKSRLEKTNRETIRREKAAATAETALYDQLLQRLYAEPYINETLKRYAERPIAIPLDGVSEVAITNNEVSFYIISEVERRRRHALNQLVDLARREENLEVRAWAETAGAPEELIKLRERMTTSSPKGLLERARAEIGDVAADVLQEVEGEISSAIFGRHHVDPDALAAQMTIVNQNAVKRIQEIAREQSAASKKTGQLNGGYEPTIAYEYKKPYGRAMLQVHLVDQKGEGATVVYPGYLPYMGGSTQEDPAVTQQLIEHIVNWYQDGARYEMIARTLTHETLKEMERTIEEIRKAGGSRWSDLRMDLSVDTKEPDLTAPEAQLVARYNLLKELYGRRKDALDSITRETPITPQQLDAFTKEQLIILGGSEVPETAERIAAVLNGIRAELKTRGKTNEVLYDVQSGMISVSGNSVEIQSVKTAKEFVDEFVK